MDQGTGHWWQTDVRGLVPGRPYRPEAWSLMVLQRARLVGDKGRTWPRERRWCTALASVLWVPDDRAEHLHFERRVPLWVGRVGYFVRLYERESCVSDS